MTLKTTQIRLWQMTSAHLSHLCQPNLINLKPNSAPRQIKTHKHSITSFLRAAGISSLQVFPCGSEPKHPQWHPGGALNHVTGCDTHGDSVCGHAGRNRSDRKPGTGRCRRSAGAAGSHRTGSPSYWSRWRRMTDRLWGGRSGGVVVVLRVSHFKYSFSPRIWTSW